MRRGGWAWQLRGALMQLIKTLRLGPAGKDLSVTGVEASGELGQPTVVRTLNVTGVEALGESSAPTAQIVVGSNFGNYTNLAALFGASDIYKFTGANATINPMDEVIPLQPAVNSYGLKAYGSPVTTVTDAVRGTVTEFFQASGTVQNQRFTGPGGLGKLGTAINVSSLSRGAYAGGSTLFTCVTATAHGWATGQIVKVSGTNTSYDGLKLITVVNATTFTWTDDGQPNTPATGTITVAAVTLPNEVGIGFHMNLVEWGTGNAKHFFIQSALNSTGLPGTAPNHYVALFLGTGQGGTGLYSPNSRLQGGGGFMNYDVPSQYHVARGTWAKVEIYWKANTPGSPNGVIQTWINGVQVTNVNTVNFFAAGQNLGWTGLWFDVTDSGNPIAGDSRYRMDDLVFVTRVTTGQANPSALPNATGQAASPITALRAAAAGSFGLDPISGVPVVKLTSSTSPNAGNHAPGYANGGPHMSQPWVSGGKTYYTLCLESSGWLIDIDYSLIGVSDPRVNLRQMPYSPGEVSYAWSMNPATPRILFVYSGGNLVRYDTQAMANAPSGIFPKAVPGGDWIQTQLNDTWMAGQNGTTYWALNTATGSVLSMSPARSGLTHDELHLDMTLPVVYLSVSTDGKNNQPWLLDSDTLLSPWSSANPIGSGTNPTEPPGASDDHCTPLRGGVAGDYFGGSPYGGSYAYNRVANTLTAIIKGSANFHDTGEFYHNAAGNFFGFGSNFNDQWVVVEKVTGGGSAPIRLGVIGMWKVDGSALKYLCSHDSINSSYGSFPQSQMSPDGRLVFWTSNMGTSGEATYQTYLAKVPTN